MSTNGDKRSVSTDALETLGTIITNQEKRDAIHLAVEPVIAGEYLIPGEDIGITKDSEGRTVAYNSKTKHVGIVDPFLEESVQEGQMFWLVVYPRQIRSLRHVWEHPDFPVSVDVEIVIPEVQVLSQQETSKQWIIDFAEDNNLFYDELMDAADQFRATGNYLIKGGDLEGRYVPDEFWEHYQSVKAITMDPNDYENFFSCSC